MKRAAYPIGVSLVIGAVLYAVFAGPGATTCETLVAEGTASTDCHPALITCPVLVSDGLLGALTAAGLPLPRPEQRYAVATTVNLVWGGDDAGIAAGTFVNVLEALGVRDDTGSALSVVNSSACREAPCDALCAAPVPIRWESIGLPCVRAPYDGGTTCLKRDGRTGDGVFVGEGNVFSASEAMGSGCEAVAAGCGDLGFIGATGGSL